MIRFHYIQHVPFEGLAMLGAWIETKGYYLSGTRLYLNENFPPLTSFDVLVILGGPMGVSDEHVYPWLTREKAFIQQAIHSQKKVIGICLGAQLIAAVLGASVYANARKEIGWFPLMFTEYAQQFFGVSPSVMAFHWHGDMFDIPRDAQKIALSEACGNQGFVYEHRVLGLQCHLESSRESIQLLGEHCADELSDEPFVQSAAQMLERTDLCVPAFDCMQLLVQSIL